MSDFISVYPTRSGPKRFSSRFGFLSERSALELRQIDEEFDILEVKHVVARCAAPGSWSWCVSRLIFTALHLIISAKCGDLPLTVAIGLHSMDLIDGVNQVQGDITNVRTAEVVKTILL
ncbi:unnamed protein product [Musa hybrid cultivar]